MVKVWSNRKSSYSAPLLPGWLEPSSSSSRRSTCWATPTMPSSTILSPPSSEQQAVRHPLMRHSAFHFSEWRRAGRLVEQQPPQGVLVCVHAGLVINRFYSWRQVSGDAAVFDRRILRQLAGWDWTELPGRCARARAGCLRGADGAPYVE